MDRVVLILQADDTASVYLHMVEGRSEDGMTVPTCEQ